MYECLMTPEESSNGIIKADTGSAGLLEFEYFSPGNMPPLLNGNGQLRASEK